MGRSKGIFDFKENKLGSSVFMFFIVSVLGGIMYLFFSTADEVEIESSSVAIQQESNTGFLSVNEDNTLTRDQNKLAVNEENVMPAIIKCVKNDCTLGEIADTLRGVFGEY